MAENGRPTVMTEEVLRKLEHAFSVGATDIEACGFADIAMSTLYLYQKDNPGFSERKEELKNMPKFAAKNNVVEKINAKDIETSKWYLERKGKDEFSAREERTGANGEAMILEVTQYDSSKNTPQLPAEGTLSIGVPSESSSL